MRVMLSGRVLMVSPPPKTALFIRAWPEDDLWARWGWLSPPVDSSCCCEITLYQLSVQNNKYQVRKLSCSLWDVMIEALACFSKPTDPKNSFSLPWQTVWKHFRCQFYLGSWEWCLQFQPITQTWNVSPVWSVKAIVEWRQEQYKYDVVMLGTNCQTHKQCNHTW